MDFGKVKAYVASIEKAATELYRDDARIRQMIDSCVHHALSKEGSRIDDHKDQEKAANAALWACSLLAARILTEDAELYHTRLERDHYKKLAMDGLFFSGPQMFVPSIS